MVGGESRTDIDCSSASGQTGLGIRSDFALEHIGEEGDSGGLAEQLTEPGGLIELSFSLLHRMEWDSDQGIPSICLEVGSRVGTKEIAEERVKPEGALILVAVDDFQPESFGLQDRPCERKVEFDPCAIAAFEGGRDLA